MTPLTKRFPRELKNNIGKYLGIFLLMGISIALTAGFLTAASSIEKLCGDMRDTYTIEDGRFTLDFEADSSSLSALKTLTSDGIDIYELFSFDVPFSQDDGVQNATARVYVSREDVDQAAYHEGEAPCNANEIALDRLFAEHNNIAVGDSVEVDGKDYVVSGLCTLPDYSALMENNTDFVMNTLTFTVALVTPEAFEYLEDHASISETYTYAFVFGDRSMTVADRIDLEKDIATTLSDEGESLSDLIDWESNQGIVYASDDVEGDQMMWEVLLMLLVIIMAFVFVVLTSSTIEAESAIIGTLLASGYRKAELLRHYVALPAFVGLAACIVGNIFGYTLLSDPMQGLYYNSYSLPPYVAVFNLRVFVITTVIPYVLLIGITTLGLMRKLGCTPLQFLRHETSKGASTKHGLRLPDKLSFAVRFRLRIFLRNLSSFVTLFFGICFASLLLLFGLCMMPTIDHYAEGLANDLVADHQYTLKAPLELDGSASDKEAWAAALELSRMSDDEIMELAASDPLEMLYKVQAVAEIDSDSNPVNTKDNSQEAIQQAEKYAAYELNADRLLGDSQETVTVYGIQEASAYWSDIDVSDEKITVGNGLAEKCGLSAGNTYEFNDPYTDTVYTLEIAATYGSSANTNVYMSLNTFNTLFDNEPDYFSGYVSNEELSFDERYLSSDVTPYEMQKISDQMSSSMSGMVGLLTGISVAIYIVLMYLLTKTVIERSARAISYLKVFGYRDREVNRFYIRSITVCVVVSLVVCLPLIIGSCVLLFKFALMEYSGNMEVYTPPVQLLEVLFWGIVSYAVVAFLHVRRIRKVPLALALKVQE